MKIPFERTISGAYRFAFTNILSIIGVGWFPFLLFGALVAGLVVLWLPQWPELWAAFGKAADPQTLDKTRLFVLLAPLAGSYLLVILALFVVQAMVNVGIMRKALGQHPGPVFIFFSLGSQVWRLLGSYLLLVLLAWGVLLLFGLGIGAIAYGVGRASEPAEAVVAGILIFVAFLWFLYAAVRVTFFIPAVVVAENHIGIRRAWHLGKGNFWRILGIVLIVTLPLGMAVNVITQSLLQMALGPEFGGTVATTPAETQRIFAEMLHAVGKIWPYYAALQLISLVLQAGLTAGASANAYRLVTGGDEIAPPPAKVPA